MGSRTRHAIMVAIALQLGTSRAAAQTLPIWQIDNAAAVTIGIDDARDGHALHNVRAAVRLSDGRIVVADGGSSELRYFTAGGDLIRRSGGPGRGPQEFRVLQSVTPLPGDSLLVLTLDPAFVLVGPTGEIVRKTPVDPARFRLPCVNPEGGLHLLPDRSLVVQSEVTGCGPRRDNLHRTNDLITHVRFGATAVDTLGVFPGTERSGPRYRIFGRMLALAQAGDRVFIGDTGTDTIRALSLPGGGLAAVWHVPIEPTLVRDVDLPTRGPSYTLPDGSRARPPEVALPETYPLFGRLLTDGGGNLWVMRYPALEEPVSSWQLKSLMGGWVVDPDGADWIVLDHQGQTVARVRTPPGVMVLEIGSDYIFGLSRDELEVESVSLYRLHR